MMTQGCWQEAWDIGDAAVLSCEVQDLTQDPAPYADPSALTCRVRHVQSGTESVYAWPTPNPGVITRDAAGRFHCTHAFTKSGRWSVRWKATGALVAAEEGYLHVSDTAFPNP